MPADAQTKAAAFDLDRIGGRRALDELVDAVLAAGEVAIDLYRSGAANRFETKPDRSPVTEADKAVEKHLKEFCARRFPSIGFLGEETGVEGVAGTRFIVDPIDGTRAFIRGIETWSILIGLEFDHEPVLGVALMPAAHDLFVGVIGGGAYYNGRPIRLSRVDSLDSALVCHGGLSQFTAGGIGPALIRLAEGTYTQRGFSDFDGYRRLLLGRADAMVDPDIKAYDICPAAVLVREAGGKLTGFKGEESLYSGGAVASNGAGSLHDELLALLAG